MSIREVTLMMKRARVWLGTGVCLPCVLFEFSLRIHFCFLIHHFLVVHSNGHCAAAVLCHVVACTQVREKQQKREKQAVYGQMMKNDYLIWLLLCARRLHSINQHLINVDDDVNIDTIKSSTGSALFCRTEWHWKEVNDCENVVN